MRLLHFDNAGGRLQRQLRRKLLEAIENGQLYAATTALTQAKHMGIAEQIVRGAPPVDNRHLLIVAAGTRPTNSDIFMAKIIARLICVHRGGMRQTAKSRPSEPITYAANAAFRCGNWPGVLVLLAHGAWLEPMNPNEVHADVLLKLQCLGMDVRLSVPRSIKADLLGTPAQWLVRLDREYGRQLSVPTAHFLYKKQPRWLHVGIIETRKEWYNSLAPTRTASWRLPQTFGAIENAVVHRIWSRTGTIAWPQIARKWILCLLIVHARLSQRLNKTLPCLAEELWHEIMSRCTPP